MRIAFLCKRHYTGKDVIKDRYGRLFEIPNQLALHGHDVRVWCFDYHGNEFKRLETNAAPGKLGWTAYAVKGLRILKLPWYLIKLKNQIKKFKPDIVIGASDIPHVALACYLAKNHGTPYMVDLYDNFESFDQTRIPGFKWLLKRSIKQASLIVAVSQPLKEKIAKDFSPECRIHVMSNGVNKHNFISGKKESARGKLGLPVNSKLIGTAGGLSRMKGVGTLYAAWDVLKDRHPDLHLVLAGSVEHSLSLPSDERVHYLGVLPEREVVTLFQALDIGVVTLQDSEFGRYCFPQKAYEMLACGLPIVATNVGVMSGLLSSLPDALYMANDPESLALAVEQQLISCTLPKVFIMDWHDLVCELNALLIEL